MQALLPLSYGMLGKKCWDRAKGMRTASSSGNNYSNKDNSRPLHPVQAGHKNMQTTGMSQGWASACSSASPNLSLKHLDEQSEPVDLRNRIPANEARCGVWLRSKESAADHYALSHHYEQKPSDKDRRQESTQAVEEDPGYHDC